MEFKITTLLQTCGRGVYKLQMGIYKKIKPNYLLQPYWIYTRIEQIYKIEDKMQECKNGKRDDFCLDFYERILT